jgi:hypothetical protein
MLVRRFLAGLVGWVAGTYVAFWYLVLTSTHLEGGDHPGAGALIGVIMGATTSLGGLLVERRRSRLSSARVVLSLLGGVGTAAAPLAIFPGLFVLATEPGPGFFVGPLFAALITAMSMIDLGLLLDES